MSAKRSQPKWEVSSSQPAPELTLFNSLTRQKEKFVPKYGKKVYWYSCGPTVYDAAHMGHARSYISFDILRRILTDYFGYDVLYVMNITDIDDKIIKRARQIHLFTKYKNDVNDLQQLLSDANCAFDFLSKKHQNTTDEAVSAMISNLIENVSSAIQGLETAIVSNDINQISKAKQVLLDEAASVFSDWLDEKYGSTVTDNKIFSELPRYWEEEFHKDMESLNVLRPNVLTRVSEYVPEIVVYIEQIIKNGLAYESNGSVYFDVHKFDSMQNHHYAKLVPEAYGDTESLQSGEGDLGDSGEKKSATDFALWKASKSGEPWWDSPWGKGRPGWHIECSVMASAICGDTLDIHTGGVDLKFPHHDNEIAQAEAYFDNNQWVSYFLHSGHLTISGCKMSKSLKNFISIAEALKKHSARQLRLAFLLHSWRDTLDYSENTMDMAKKYEKMLNEFFLTIKDISRTKSFSEYDKWTTKEINLNSKFFSMRESVHSALCDNIDTRTALENIRECITYCNSYIREDNCNYVLLRDIALYITKIMNIFGTIPNTNSVGFPVKSDSSVSNVEDVVMPFLKTLGNFRDEIRAHAKVTKEVEILKICDRLRDEILPEVGVRLEDREGKPCAIKLLDNEMIMREKEEQRKAEEEKLKKKKELEAAKLEKQLLQRISPKEMFLSMKDKYSIFDDKGMPTHDAEGKELSKGQIKKLQKLYTAQEKKHNDYIATCNSSA